jgi:hypothetical protein
MKSGELAPTPSWIDQEFIDSYPPHWNGVAYPGQRQSGGKATDPERPSKLAQKLVCLHPSGEKAQALGAGPVLPPPELSDELAYPNTINPELWDEPGMVAVRVAITPPATHTTRVTGGFCFI